MRSAPSPARLDAGPAPRHHQRPGPVPGGSPAAPPGPPALRQALRAGACGPQEETKALGVEAPDPVPGGRQHAAVRVVNHDPPRTTRGASLPSPVSPRGFSCGCRRRPRPVRAPLPHVAVHLVQAPGVRGEGFHRHRLLAIFAGRAAVVGDGGVVVGLLRGDRVATPVEGRLRARTAGVFPLRLRRQACRQPGQKPPGGAGSRPRPPRRPSSRSPPGSAGRP
jgi:hypothetical protein